MGSCVVFFGIILETVDGVDNDDDVVVVVVADVNDTTADSTSKFCLYISGTVGVHSCSYPKEGERRQGSEIRRMTAVYAQC